MKTMESDNDRLCNGISFIRAKLFPLSEINFGTARSTGKCLTTELPGLLQARVEGETGEGMGRC